MKKLILVALTAFMGLTATSQVANYALQFEPTGNVVCGPMQKLDGAKSYTIQMWINPTQWNLGANVISRGTGFAVRLGGASTVEATVGATTISIKSDKFAEGKWSQLTLVCDAGKATAYVDGIKAAEGALDAIPADDATFIIGGDYTGRIDEVRVWDIALPDEFDRFWNTTLNEWVPNVANLVAYYKMDYSEVKNLVEYGAIWNPERSEFNNHGIIASGVSRVKVDDNAGLPYLVNGAYTANERFWDRAIPRNQYLVANDLIILGIQSYPDGHLEYVSPNSHATVSGGEYVASFEGRDNVLYLNGEGAEMVAPATAFKANEDGFNNWAFQSWVYIEEWNEGAFIVRQESADGQQGFSVRLGDKEKNEMITRVNGVDFRYYNRVSVGEWFNIAVCPNNGTSYAAMCMVFYINGKNYNISAAPSAFSNAPAGAENEPVRFGENFKGYLDDINTWSRVSSKDEVNRYMKELPMPGIGIQQTADVLFKALTYYRFNDPEDLGYNSFSQDEWLRIMKSAYDGYTGYVVRISVKSHSGWQNTISTEARRKIFAADLARLTEPYDGCELDLEWAETTSQINTLGLLAQEIRAALPAEKSFFISCHSYAATYQFPRDKMQYVDGFTFQNYGPQNGWFYYSRYEQLAQTFINWGFPKDKIVMSYAATTSKGFKDGSAVTPIKGVRDGFLGDDYVPNDEVDSRTIGDYTYYFTGPTQTYNRAKLCVERNLGGIFYWDMGNDVPFESKYNLAKNCSYALSANVDRIVTEVTPMHDSGVDNVAGGFGSKQSALQVSNDRQNLSVAFANGERVASVDVYAMSGAKVAASKGNLVGIEHLANGVYTVNVKGQDGAVKALKFVKK